MKEFLEIKEAFDKEMKRLPKSLETHQKLLQRVDRLELKTGASGSAPKEPPLPADYVKACMELICDFADLLKARDKNPGIISAHELVKLGRQVTTHMAKLNLVGEYVSDAAKSAALSSSDAETLLDSSQDSPFVAKSK